MIPCYVCMWNVLIRSSFFLYGSGAQPLLNRMPLLAVRLKTLVPFV